MKILTAGEMREIDRRTIEEFGIPGAVLMENAGIGVVVVLQDRFPHLAEDRRFLDDVVCPEWHRLRVGHEDSSR